MTEVFETRPSGRARPQNISTTIGWQTVTDLGLLPPDLNLPGRTRQTLRVTPDHCATSGHHEVAHWLPPARNGIPNSSQLWKTPPRGFRST
jgi:hypothetical protein